MIDSLSSIFSTMSIKDFSLFLLTTFTSTIAGVFGLGGGLVLAVMLPWFVLPSAVVPIHGATQLASNVSRLMMSYKHIVWSLVPKFMIGSLVGVVLFTLVLSNLALQYIPVFIAIYLLLSLWVKSIDLLLSKIESFYLVGMLQTGLGLVVGAPGPLTVNLLMKKLAHREQIIATASLLMVFVNATKVVTYAALGFVFIDYLNTIVFAIIGAFVGSYIGTKLRDKIDAQRFLHWLKWLLTLLALQTLVRFSWLGG